MDRKTINKVLELTEFQKQLNELGLVLNYHNPTSISITNNTGVCKNFNTKMIEELNKFYSEMRRELNEEFEKL